MWNNLTVVLICIFLTVLLNFLSWPVPVEYRSLLACAQFSYFYLTAFTGGQVEVE